MPEAPPDTGPDLCLNLPCVARRGPGCGVAHWQDWLVVCNQGHISARRCPWFAVLIAEWKKGNA